MNPEKSDKASEKPLRAITNQHLLHYQQKELEHKGGQRQYCYVAAVVGKRHLGDEATSSSEEIKLVTLPIVRLCWLKASVN